MNKEDKELLLKDLSTRLPYGVKCLLHYTINNETTNGENVDAEEVDAITKIDIPTNMVYTDWYGSWSDIEDCKPFLRPMSSMTDEEKAVYSNYRRVVRGLGLMFEYNMDSTIEWLLQHHLDYRGLIEKGLAFEAPKDMYKIKVL